MAYGVGSVDAAGGRDRRKMWAMYAEVSGHRNGSARPMSSGAPRQGRAPRAGGPGLQWLAAHARAASARLATYPHPSRCASRHRRASAASPLWSSPSAPSARRTKAPPPQPRAARRDPDETRGGGGGGGESRGRRRQPGSGRAQARRARVQAGAGARDVHTVALIGSGSAPRAQTPSQRRREPRAAAGPPRRGSFEQAAAKRKREAAGARVRQGALQRQQVEG